MKLTIDIPKKVVTAIKNGEDYRYDLHTAIAQGVPYEERPQDNWKSYCEGQEVGFKKAEDVFERMKLVQETVDCMRNSFNLDTESDKLVRNCMALVQNAIDGEYHDMEEVDVSEIERPKGKWLHPYTTNIACECSKCHLQLPITDYFNFCPNCGAYMKGGTEEGKV